MKPGNTPYSDARREAEIHDDSMTEVSVSLLSDDGKQWKRADIEDGRRTTQPSWCARTRSFCQRWRWLADTFMLFVIIGLLLERRGLQTTPRDKRLEPVGDLTGFAPESNHDIPPNNRLRPDDPKKLFTNTSIQENWLSIVPKGLGYLFAPRTVFTTSMTHQLHCLYAILESYAGLAVNGSAAVDMHSHIPRAPRAPRGRGISSTASSTSDR
ncbi:hypothetical protein Ct61P_10128 [Colletotrichum tofieldiae]|nr:hypothetical protein Ct61P_10128 [Colletotrichum tofieldiae]